MEEDRRWLTPVGLAVIGLVVAATLAGGVGPGTSGQGPFVTAGLVCYVVAGLAFVLWRQAPEPVMVAALLVMSAAAAVIHPGDPDGPVIGLYLGAAFAPLRLPTRAAALVCVAGSRCSSQRSGSKGRTRSSSPPLSSRARRSSSCSVRCCIESRSAAASWPACSTASRAAREAETRAAAMAERSRVAREMHDVLAHTLSSLVVQLEGHGCSAGPAARTTTCSP